MKAGWLRKGLAVLERLHFIPAQPVAWTVGAVGPTQASACLPLLNEGYCHPRERLLEQLRRQGVAEPVLAAMTAVPREIFVDAGLQHHAYQDRPLWIGHGQTISRPSVVAHMLQLVWQQSQRLQRPRRVLEIGTGCGYQAAVLSHLFEVVYTVERIKDLFELAKTHLRPLRIPNLRLHYGDGRLGLAEAAPFDAIVVAAAAPEIPKILLEQLAVGGCCVAPVGEAEQNLTMILRIGERRWRSVPLNPVFFVPLRTGVS